MNIAVTPNRITIYPERSYKAANQNQQRLIGIKPVHNQAQSSVLSKKAQKRLRNSINWLLICSKKRQVKVNDRIKLYNFQASFVTLTLPAKQMHSHADIKSKCLNLFLTTIRQKFGVKNYIWKAELQKNGNIHFHLTLDKYIHFMQIRKYWNMALNTLGYVDDYAKRHQNLTLDQYIYWQRQNGQNDVSKVKKSYSYGVSTNWRSPNTTDVKAIKNVKNFASYMAKYLVKPLGNNKSTGIFSDSLASFTGRLWYCSTTVSKLSAYRTHLTLELRAWVNTFAQKSNVLSIKGDYATSYYFDLSKVPKQFLEFIRQCIFSHAVKSNYPFPSQIPIIF